MAFHWADVAALRKWLDAERVPEPEILRPMQTQRFAKRTLAHSSHNHPTQQDRKYLPTKGANQLQQHNRRGQFPCLQFGKDARINDAAIQQQQQQGDQQCKANARAPIEERLRHIPA